MAKKNKFKRNKSDIPSNIFDGGGIITDMYTLNISGPKLSQSGLPLSYLTGLKYGNMGNTSNAGSNLMSSLGNTALGMGAGIVGNLGGNLIAGGKLSGIGSTIGSLGNTIGSAAMMVNPLVGGAIMGGTSLLGGAFNAVFGSKLNKERIALAENEINAAKSFNADASNFDALSLLIANSPVIAGFSLKDIGSDGLFSNKAKNKYKSLLALKEFAENWVDRSIANAATNLLQLLVDNLLLNYAAYGGLLDYGSSGAIDYDLANRQLGIESMKAMSLNRQYSLPNMELNTFAEGGGIHIKPSKKGTFTAAAKKHGKGVQEFASLVLANKENYSPAMVKKANFARNATKFKHAFGGDLLTNGTVFSNGVTTIGNGGTHEESPYEGVLMGIDPLGIPNLVEEGELIWNDYVFSNRIKVPNSVKDKYKLRGTKDMSFSDAAKKILKASEERPNDPIANDTLNINLTRLANEQEIMRELRNMDNKNTFKRGGKKYTKKQIGLSAWDAYNQMLTNPYVDSTTGFSEGLDVNPNLAALREKAIRSTYNNTNNNLNNYATWLRYAPVLGSTLGLSLTLLSSPNYSRADALAKYAENAGKVTPISYDPLSNYLTYRPMDTNYAANRMAALAAATRRNIMNTSGGNRANAIGSLLAADYNALVALADALRQDTLSNIALQQQVEQFNRATNLANSEMALKAAMANLEARLKASQLGLSGYSTAMLMKDAIDALRNASINANLSSLFESLGNIGVDEYNRMDRDMLIKSGVFGTLNDIAKRAAGIKSAKGGKLNKKKRGGFTY